MHRKSPKGTPLADRLAFHSTPEPNSGCRLWTAGVDTRGYAHLRINGVQRLAHRVAYELAHGPIPAGLLVCHKCDVKTCINPKHLFLGTHKDNSDDMIAKGRDSHTVGQDCPVAKLTEDQARAIRSDKRRYREIAEDYGISVMQAWRVKNGSSWAHLGAPI